MKYSIFVDNLKCGSCANTIKKTVSKFSKVQDVIVDTEQTRVDVVMEHDEIQLDMIKQKLAKIGYPERGTEYSRLAEAKSYVSCAIGRIGV